MPAPAGVSTSSTPSTSPTSDIIDLGPNAPDYRWHAEVPRNVVAQTMYDQVMDLDYSSHVKEEVAGADNIMYSAMMGCWRELHKLQDPPELDPDWWFVDDGGDPYRPVFHNPQADDGEPPSMDTMNEIVTNRHPRRQDPRGPPRRRPDPGSNVVRGVLPPPGDRGS